MRNPCSAGQEPPALVCRVSDPALNKFKSNFFCVLSELPCIIFPSADGWGHVPYVPSHSNTALIKDQQIRVPVKLSAITPSSPLLSNGAGFGFGHALCKDRIMLPLVV